ncbi:MAG: winged helix-turn-helix domain-containing protein [Actinomycetota bacterium]
MSAQPERPAFVLDSIEQLKGIADTLRLQILLEVADDPRTVKQIAAKLGVPQTRLYYHMKLLERLGFIRVVARRMVSGIEERSYLATAASWNISPDLLASVGKVGVLKAMFDLVATELDLAMSVDGPPPGEKGSAVAALSYTALWLDDEQMAEVRRRLESVMLEFGTPNPNDQSKTEYHALLTVYKRIDAAS